MLVIRFLELNSLMQLLWQNKLSVRDIMLTLAINEVLLTNFPFGGTCLLNLIAICPLTNTIQGYEVFVLVVWHYGKHAGNCHARIVGRT